MVKISSFYKKKKILVTGHTGFKGAWLCRILNLLGGEVYGYSLQPPTDPNLYDILESDLYVESLIGDIRDKNTLDRFFSKTEPDVVIHMAAQPLVREGYIDPRGTYDTNVMGTVNIMECVRGGKNVTSFLNVTTDKVYENKEWMYGYREVDRLDGYDPYSNSKSCSDLITHSYMRSFFSSPGGCSISVARAGNVIGGGDFANDRIVPDCVRAATSDFKLQLRNPVSTRPYQHVLEPLFAYLLIAKEQAINGEKAGAYNIGPKSDDNVTTGEIADMFCELWGNGLSWENISKDGPHEATFLKLDCSKIEWELGWSPVWNVRNAVEKTVEWTKAWISGEEMGKFTDEQIVGYMRDANVQ